MARTKSIENITAKKTITLSTIVTYGVGSTVHPEVFMSEVGKRRMKYSLSICAKHYNIDPDGDISYAIIGIDNCRNFRVIVKVGDDYLWKTDMTVKGLQDGWFGQDSHPWWFCESYEHYRAGQEPDYLGDKNYKII